MRALGAEASKGDLAQGTVGRALQIRGCASVLFRNRQRERRAPDHGRILSHARCLVQTLSLQDYSSKAAASLAAPQSAAGAGSLNFNQPTSSSTLEYELIGGGLSPA